MGDSYQMKQGKCNMTNVSLHDNLRVRAGLDQALEGCWKPLCGCSYNDLVSDNSSDSGIELPLHIGAYDQHNWKAGTQLADKKWMHDNTLSEVFGKVEWGLISGTLFGELLDHWGVNGTEDYPEYPVQEGGQGAALTNP